MGVWGTWQSLLQHVPKMDLQFDGDCAQANGLDLPVVVINLRRRPDRWQAFSHRMYAAGLTKLTRAVAIDGRQLPTSDIAALLGIPDCAIDQGPRSHLALTRPAVGCFLSHLAIWRWVLHRNFRRVMVFEDDAAPAAGYRSSHFCDVVVSIPEEVGLVFLGRIIMGGLADRTDGSHLARIYYFNGTFAYMITPAACHSLLQHLLPLQSHIDHQMSRVLIEHRRVFSAYYTEPQFFEPDWTLRSDCYVPLSDDAVADQELAQIIGHSRQVLMAEGRPLLPPK